MKDFLKNVLFKHQFSGTDLLIFITFIKIGNFLESIGNFSPVIQLLFMVILFLVLKLSDAFTRFLFKE